MRPRSARESKLAQHDFRNGPEILLRQVVEANDLIHPVQKLRPQELPQGLHGALLPLLCQGLAKAQAAALPVGAGVGGHDDDGVLKVDQTALGVGDPAVVQDLQQNVQHIGVRLFDLVEENDTVGPAADFSVSWPASS